MEPVWSAVSDALGLHQDSLTVGQMAARAVVVYAVGLALVRLGDKRFIGKFSAFDVIMGIMIGSILSRAITTADAFFPILTAALFLVLMHYGFAVLAYHSSWFGDIVKGHTRTLVENGQINWDAMRGGHISEKDLRSALRENARTDEVSEVKQAILERSGNISVILNDD